MVVEHGNIFETTQEKSADLMNAVNANDGAAHTSTTDRTVGTAERLRVAEIPQTCVLESAPEVVLDVIHG